MPHPLQDRIRHFNAGHLVLHELGVLKAGERPHARNDGYRSREAADRVKELQQGFGIKDGLCDGILGAGVDLAAVAVEFALHFNGAGIDPDPDQDTTGRVNRVAADVDSAVEVAGNLCEADGVYIEDPRNIGVVADLRRIAGDDQEIGDARGIAAEDIRLHANQVAVAAAVVEDGFNVHLLMDGDRGDHR